MRPGDVRFSKDPAKPIDKLYDYAAAEKDPAFNGLLFNFDGTVRSGFGDPRQIQAGLKYQF